MRIPINIAEIYTGLERLLLQLPPPALLAVTSVLRSAPPEVLRLGFVPLRPGTPVEIHDDFLYTAASQYTTSSVERADDCLWIVIDMPSRPGAAADAAAADVQAPVALDLAKLLEGFDFLAPLTCTSDISRLDPELARQITAVQRLRPVCEAGLHGGQLSFYAPVAMACSDPRTLHLSALSPLDAPPTGYIRLRMSVAPSGQATFVVLGRNPITLDPDPTVSLTPAT